MTELPARYVGHDEAWREWRTALSSERMHHAWLLTGPEGIGKGGFARKAALELVGKGEGRQPEPSAHPDILVLDHLPSNDDEARKRTDGKPFQVKRNITVEQIRAMQQRLTTRATLGANRAVIIDPADDLEKAGVNALLKSLEEPPAGTHFLLVSHRPGRLLPTVRSRCRILRFPALPDEAIDGLLREQAPDVSFDARKAAIAAAQGSPGVALAFARQGLGKLHELMERIVRQGDRDFTLRGMLADEIGARPSREKLLGALDLARAALTGALDGAGRRQQLVIIEAHGAMARLSAEAPTYNFDPGLLVMEIGGLLASAAVPTEAVEAR